MEPLGEHMAFRQRSRGGFAALQGGRDTHPPSCAVLPLSTSSAEGRVGGSKKRSSFSFSSFCTHRARGHQNKARLWLPLFSAPKPGKGPGRFRVGQPETVQDEQPVLCRPRLQRPALQHSAPCRVTLQLPATRGADWSVGGA